MRTLGRLHPIAALSLALSLAAGPACMPEADVAQKERQAGDEQWKKGAFKEAAAAYQRSLEANPKQEKVLEKLAMCRVRLDDKDGAAAALLKIIELKPDGPARVEVYRNVAGIYLQAQDAENGEKYLKEVLKLVPNDENSLTWLGELAAQRGGARANDAEAQPDQLDLAIKYYDQLIALKPDSTQPLAFKRIVLTKYVNHIAQRLRAAADSQKGKGKAKATPEDEERIAKLRARDAELRPMLAEVDAKLVALRKKAAAQKN
jgi:tetratricopeptide (TPR) repeat protein